MRYALMPIYFHRYDADGIFPMGGYTHVMRVKVVAELRRCGAKRMRWIRHEGLRVLSCEFDDANNIGRLSSRVMEDGRTIGRYIFAKPLSK
jgi:hypothetical protein